MSNLAMVTRLRGRTYGFTLIELLTVLTIIGILATIAVGKIGRTRERAHYKAMMSDLRNLQAQQEVYYATPTSNYRYAASTSDLVNYANSQGVAVAITTAANSGWAATAGHAALTVSQLCAIFVGTVTTVPSPATTQGIVTCTGD